MSVNIVHVLDELPGGTRGVGNKSKYGATLAEIKSNEEYHGKAVGLEIFAEEDSKRAMSSAVALRQSYGPVEANGWRFSPRKATDGRTVLYAVYSPDAVVEGADGKWRADRSTKAKAAAARAAARKAAAAASGTTPEPGKRGRPAAS